jgi:hypothetical protein
VEVEVHGIAYDVTGIVIPECGHFVKERLHGVFIYALMPFRNRIWMVQPILFKDTVHGWISSHRQSKH